MSNPTWRKTNWFAAFSGIGKQQTALGEFLADADLDTRDKCEVEITDEVTRGEERNCDDVDIVGRPVRRRSVQIRLTYNRVSPQIMARFYAYHLGVAASATGSSVNEVQTLTRSGTVSGGTFTIALTIEGRTGITKPIAWNASNSAIQAALVNAAASIGKIIKLGDVTVTGTWGTGVILTFGGRLAKANLPLAVIDNTLITGGGSVAIAQTTAGDNKYHAITRSTNNEKPLFTIACGDKLGSVATRKYGDCVVMSLTPTFGLEQENVQLVVVIAASYNPELVEGFTVPACVNIPPLRSVDVRKKINNIWETRDIVSSSMQFDDQVPIEAGFEFDDVDFSLPLERGNQPTQNFTDELFGGEDSDIYALAELGSVDTPTQTTVEYITHFGNPGNRCSVIAPETFISFQAQRNGFAGPLEKRTTRINAEPWGVTGNPFRVEAYLDQTAQFLDT